MGQLFSKPTHTTDEVLFLETKSESTKTDDAGEIPAAEEVAELRTKAELPVPIDQKAQTSNFRKGLAGFFLTKVRRSIIQHLHLDSNSILVFLFQILFFHFKFLFILFLSNGLSYLSSRNSTFFSNFTYFCLLPRLQF